MDCGGIQKKLSAFQDGELTSREKEEVSSHLQSCPGCRERYAELEKVWKMLGDFGEILPRPGFYGELVRKINKSSETSSGGAFQWVFQFFSSPLAASTLLVLGILLGTLFGNILVKSDLFPFRQNQSANFQAAAEVFSLRSFDPIPPGTLADQYLRMAANQGEELR